MKCVGVGRWEDGGGVWGDIERGRTDWTGWTSRRGRTDGMGGRETRISNIEF